MALLSQRLKNEIIKINNDKKLGINNSMYDICMTNNMYFYKGMIYGPKESIYENYSFEIELSLPLNYPFSAPSVRFITPIKHININDNGDICLNILKNNWNPQNTISSTLISIFYLLSQPNFDDAFNDDLLQMYNDNKNKYMEYIKQFCIDKAKKN